MARFEGNWCCTSESPAAAVASHLLCDCISCAQRLQTAVYRRRPFPVLKLDGPQAMAQPLVQLSPDSWCLRQPEVCLPAQQAPKQIMQDINKLARESD